MNEQKSKLVRLELNGRIYKCECNSQWFRRVAGHDKKHQCAACGRTKQFVQEKDDGRLITESDSRRLLMKLLEEIKIHTDNKNDVTELVFCFKNSRFQAISLPHAAGKKTIVHMLMTLAKNIDSDSNIADS